jgi:phage regulator Rha-like protein
MNELVKFENGKVVTTSLIVAEKFGKEHRHVLDSIRSIISSAENSDQYYLSDTYKDKSGKSNPQILE